MVGKTVVGMRLGALFVVMVLAAACSGDDGSSESTAPTTMSPTTTAPPPPETTTTVVATTTTTQAPTTTRAPATTTTDPLARPEVLVSNFDRESVDDFDTTGDNLWEVMLEIQDLFNYLEGNPEGTGEQMLGMLYVPTHSSWENLLLGFDELAANDWRYVDPGTRTVALDVESADGASAVVTWASERGDQRIADRDGEIVKVYRGWDLDLLTYRLERANDGRWRIAETIDRMAPVPASVLETMVTVEWTGRQ